MLTGSLTRPEIKADLYPTSHRLHMAGFDMSMVYDEFTVRAEMAYFWDRYHLRDINEVLEEYQTSEKQAEIAEEAISAGGGLRYYTEPLLEVKKDSIEYGFGMDYLMMGGNIVITGQLLTQHILDYDLNLIFNKWDTYAVGVIQLYFMERALKLEIPGIYTMPESSFFYKPSLAYNITDELKITLGAIILDGDPNNYLGEYQKNDQFYTKVRFSY